MKILRTLCFTCLVMSPIGSAQAQDENVARKELEAVYAKMSGAWKRGDLKGYMAVYAPLATYKALDGRAMNREEREARQKEALARRKSLKNFTVTVEKVTREFSRMVAIVHIRAAGVQADEAGKSHSFTRDLRARHVWMKTRRGWLLQDGEELPGGKFTVDGKPVGTPVKK
jgi:hypothetical protein